MRTGRTVKRNELQKCKFAYLVHQVMSGGGLQWDHLVAGISGGFCSTLVVHPLDLLKVRFAANEGNVNRPQHSGYLSAAKSIVSSRGFSGLFLGVTPNLIGGTVAWGLYFQFYNIVKSWLHIGTTSNASPGKRIIAGGISGAAVLTLTNPIWVVKTRICMQYEGQPRIYKGFIDALAKTYKSDGIRGWYKGYSAGLVGTSHGAVQLMIYEETKLLYLNYFKMPVNSKLGNTEYIIFSAFSKIVAATLTYPYQVVRIRLQDQHSQYSSVWDVIKRTFTGEGYRGFYKGLLPSLLRVTPSTCVTFVVYENVLYLLNKHTSIPPRI